MADALTPPAQVLQLQGVCKSFNVGLPNEIEILHDISMTLGRGEFCAVMGPSGSGKSTLLNIIGLLDRPSQGQLFIGTENTTQLDDKSLTGATTQFKLWTGAFHKKRPVLCRLGVYLKPRHCANGHQITRL